MANAVDERTETRLFGALDGALRDVPPSRIGGAIMVTDGQIHDVPATADFNAPLHALITGQEGEKDRRIRFENAPRFGIVDKPLDMTYRVIGAPGETGSGRRPRQHQRPAGVDGDGRDRPRDAAAAHHTGRRQQHRRTVDRPRRGRTHRRQQPCDRHGRRHPREFARAAGFGRAACRRANLAQPAEVRRLGRSRPLHHPAAAGKAGRHADQRTVADRLPDARAVRREDQRFRPDHLRSLSAPRRAADPLLRLHLGICGEGRRAADCRRPRICRRTVDRQDAADRRAAGAADRRRRRPGLLSPAHRARQTPSGDARPRRLDFRAAALEPLVPADRRFRSRKARW